MMETHRFALFDAVQKFLDEGSATTPIRIEMHFPGRGAARSEAE
jgi:hypothetical protein